MKSLLAAGWAVFRKDVRTELRTRVALSTLLLFSICVLVLAGYAVGPTSLAPEDRPTVNSVLLWIVLFFSALSGLARSFVTEEETGTAHALRLTAPPAAVLLGKLLFNLALLLVVNIVVVPLFLAMLSFDIAGPALFVTLLVLGDLALASASTFVAAIVAKAQSKGSLFPVLAIPLLLPPLIGAVTGTRIAATDPSFLAGIEHVKLLVSFTGAMTTAAFLLFPTVFEE